MIKQEDVTIIIPHLFKEDEGLEQREYALTHCWKSLIETVKCPIIIIHNGLVHGDAFISDGKPDQIKIIAMEDQGQCKAVNAAAATVNTEWIFITNDDMVYAPGWFEKLMMHQPGTRLVDLDDPNVLCISPMLIEPRPGAPTFETHFCGGAGGDFNKQEWLRFAREKMDNAGWGLRTGFNFPVLIKKELWDLIGGYDVNYDPWGSNSDSDLEYKIMLAGIQPYQNMNSVVYHFGQTSGTFEPQNSSYWHNNFKYFIDKWGFSRTDEGIWQANFKMPDKERIFRPHWEGFYNR